MATDGGLAGSTDGMAAADPNATAVDPVTMRALDLWAFIGWVCSTHVRRWCEHRHTVGEGHLYQGRFKSFPIQQREPLYRVLRYVEGNARRAALAEQAEAWRYSSLYPKQHRPEHRVELSPWPVPRTRDWADQVNRAIEEEELNRIRLHIQRGRPYGTVRWIGKALQRMGLESSLRDRGRPKKPTMTSGPFSGSARRQLLLQGL